MDKTGFRTPACLIPSTGRRTESCVATGVRTVVGLIECCMDRTVVRLNMVSGGVSKIAGQTVLSSEGAGRTGQDTDRACHLTDTTG